MVKLLYGDTPEQLRERASHLRWAATSLTDRAAKDILEFANELEEAASSIDRDSEPR